ncbi:cytoplasmic 60S subunit biogenesis factor ZNF622-like [Lepeophtheirus salmonis]|uniref:cytoplasmic 60S subunit biogenesis factor ZNF622-like n=1 Tax=Lepeophtheirus salmonis TaxID=72036 RepID=UPI001AEA17AC|nr:zinc finger protein 622-like [Lepeophtheirus salmonis]
MSLQYTCVTCHVAFQDSDNQRNHYKTDWHRYNLKRKVENLPPVNLSNFDERKKALEKELQELNGENKPPSGYCMTCSKSFATEKAYENHLNSKKHKDKFLRFDETKAIGAKKAESKKAIDPIIEDENMEIVDSDEWDGEEAIPITDCLFCSHHSSTLPKNIKHMGEQHSFFIPDIDYLIDVEGLFTYLGAKVGEGFMCIWCNERGKTFHDKASVQKHMLDKGHCKILNEGGALIEFEDYYDYSSSYPENEKENKDEEVQLNELDDSGFELTLPSGAKIGHRSLFRYFKQRINPTREVVLCKRNTSHLIANSYRQYGWVTASSSLEIKRKVKDLKFIRQVQQKHSMQIGCKANKLQKYRRDPTIVFG